MSKTVPIDKALELEVEGSLLDQVGEAVAIVKGLHGVREPRRICPVRPSAKPENRSLRGYLEVDPEDEAHRGLHIGILQDGPWVQSTTVHELGHLWDFAHFGDDRFASASDPALFAWRTALVETDCYKRLKDLHRAENIDAFRNGVSSPEVTTQEFRNYIRYLLRPNEWLARSYFMWVVLRSQNDILLSQLDDVRLSDDELTCRPHWSNDEFAESVGPVLDELFGLA